MENQNLPLEIERKFLIRYPDIQAIMKLPGARRLNMVQTYLVSAPGVTARVRRIEENGNITRIYTEKTRISARTATEIEREITEEEYKRYLQSADPERMPIEKVRYAVPFGNHTAEIDVYPFWNDRAVLEIELTSEKEDCPLPDYLTVIREVTENKRYKNVNLAKCVPNDPIA